LQVALALFNERGTGRVTTAEIAEAARINEGNLYYYFQRKEHLAEALFDLFETATMAAAGSPLADPADPVSYAAYQRGWFRLMWDFRFFYRDGAALGAAAALHERFRALNASGQAAVRRVLGQMQAHGLLHASPLEIEVLIKNLWIVSANWMDFRLMETGEGQITPVDLAWGFRQVEMLYHPYLTPQAYAVMAGRSGEP
jgi:AcrR family transcriptional regulator